MVDIITLISPNGGEVWTPGSTQTIRWSSTSPTNTLGPNVKIQLWKDYGVKLEIVYSTPNTGSYVWTIPSTLTTGTNYSMLIMGCTLNTAGSCTDYIIDMSDVDFTIGSSSICTNPKYKCVNNVCTSDNCDGSGTMSAGCGTGCGSVCKDPLSLGCTSGIPNTYLIGGVLLAYVLISK